MDFPGMRQMVAFVPAEQPGSHNALVVAPTGQPGRTGDPVKDLEAKLKYIQDTVPNKISNVSGRHGASVAQARAFAPLTRTTALLAQGPATSTSTAWCAGACYGCFVTQAKRKLTPASRPQARRREQDRLTRMDEEEAEAVKQQEYEAKQALRLQAGEARAERNRLKRAKKVRSLSASMLSADTLLQNKRKGAKKLKSADGGAGDGAGPEEESSEEEGAGGPLD